MLSINIHNNKKRRTVLATLSFALLLVALLAASPASAQKSLECDKVWTSATNNNDLLDCIANKDRIVGQWRYLVWSLFCVILFLVILIGVPIFWCCRCCSCCHDCLQPHKDYSRKRARCWLWMWIIIAVLWACAVCVFIVYGANELTTSASDLLDNVRHGPLDYVRTVKAESMTLLTDYSTTPPTPPTIDMSTFDDFVTDVDREMTTIKNDYFKYFKIVKIVSIVVGVVGVVLMLLILPFAFCRCGGCCPVVFTILYYFFGIIFSLLAIVLTVVQYLVTSICGEVQMQYRREPGLFQWKLVPWCEEQFDFAAIRDQVNVEVEKNSKSACTTMLNYCDASSTYDESKQQVIFTCGSTTPGGTPLASGAECDTIQKCTNAILSSYVKEDLNNMLCTDRSGWLYQEQCTVSQCATRCSNFDNPNIQAKEWTSEIVQGVGFALNTSTALSYVMPMLSCDFVLDKVLGAIEAKEMSNTAFLMDTPKEQICSNIHMAAVTVSCGFFIGALMFLIGVYVIVRGSFVWPEEYDRIDNKSD